MPNLSQNPSEKQVVLSEVSDEQAKKMLAKDARGIGGLEEAILQYKPINDFTTFFLKYALEDRDVVVQFFPCIEFSEIAELPMPVHPVERAKAPAELVEKYKRISIVCQQLWPKYEVYWLNMFPTALNEVAQEHFKATSPRLVAKYTEELKSWWLRARGYDHLIDLDGFMGSFAEKLDRRLEQK
jgi:hypothetical protein